MTIMDEAMKKLGIEYDEEFQLEGDIEKYRITVSSIQYLDSYYWTDFNGGKVLLGLLNGEFKIKPKKWKPKVGEPYYITDLIDIRRYQRYTWNNDKFDNCVSRNNLAFQTKEEAIANAESILEFLRTKNSK